MRTTLAVTAAAALTAGAHAQTEIQTQNIVSDGILGNTVSFNAFDTMGGMRTLDSVTIDVAGGLSYEITVESYDPVDYAAGSWSLESNFQAVFAIDEGPFYGFGGIGAQGITGDLGAGMGGNPFTGTPGTPYVETITGSFFGVNSVDSGDFGFFTGAGSVDLMFLPFTEFLFTQTPVGAGFISAFASSTTIDAEVTLTYGFTVVPAPGVAAVAGLGLLGAARRRR